MSEPSRIRIKVSNTSIESVNLNAAAAPQWHCNGINGVETARRERGMSWLSVDTGTGADAVIDNDSCSVPEPDCH